MQLFQDSSQLALAAGVFRTLRHRGTADLQTKKFMRWCVVHRSPTTSKPSLPSKMCALFVGDLLVLPGAWKGAIAIHVPMMLVTSSYSGRLPNLVQEASPTSECPELQTLKTRRYALEQAVQNESHKTGYDTDYKHPMVTVVAPSVEMFFFF